MKDHESKPVKLDSLCKSWSQVHTVDQTVHPPTSIALLASVCLSAAGIDDSGVPGSFSCTAFCNAASP